MIYSIVFDEHGKAIGFSHYEMVSAIDFVLPAGEVECSYEQYASYLNYRLESGEIVPISSADITRREQAEAAKDGRAWRDAKLVENEWLVARHRDERDAGESTTLASDQFSALIDFRRVLRDWPASDGFPLESSRPAAPEWLAAALTSK